MLWATILAIIALWAVSICKGDMLAAILAAIVVWLLVAQGRKE